MTLPESKLMQAARHVRDGRLIVIRQREIIAKLKPLGLDTDKAEKLLDQFESSLAIFEEDLTAARKH